MNFVFSFNKAQGEFVYSSRNLLEEEEGEEGMGRAREPRRKKKKKGRK